jgi:hypothetical protein
MMNPACALLLVQTSEEEKDAETVNTMIRFIHSAFQTPLRCNRSHSSLAVFCPLPPFPSEPGKQRSSPRGVCVK